MTRPSFPCPICKAELETIDSEGNTPPYLCRTCSRGWWKNEITPRARALFRPDMRDFGEPNEENERQKLMTLVERDDACTAAKNKKGK